MDFTSRCHDITFYENTRTYDVAIAMPVFTENCFMILGSCFFKYETKNEKLS